MQDCNKILTPHNNNISAYEKFKILSITGGVPRYLEEIQMSLTAEENIKRLCFIKTGILFREFNDIFSDLFSKKSTLYKKIVKVLVAGSCEYNDICSKLGISKNGHLSADLNDLIKSGFITRDYTWHLNTNDESSLSNYRLSDNYLRFYLKYIDKNRGKITQNHFEAHALSNLSGWDTIMGLQFENLVLNNRRAIWDKLNIYPEDIISDNPFFQRKTTRLSGCQIDYLIHTKFNTLYVCEIKFSRNLIGVNIINAMQQKINSIKTPKGFSYRPVLIHVNGISDEVIEKNFFTKIINFGELLD